MTQTIEQLTARVAELEAEVERLSAAHVKACQANADSQTELAKAEQRVIRQYYYKNNSCKAESAHDPDCVCWHDEGTGPMQPLIDGTYVVQMTWRKFVKEEM